MSNVPDIRFKGFTDAWEQRKLGDVVKITMGQSPNSINYTNNPDDYILVQGNADMKNGFVHPRVWTTQITKTAEVGDIILSVRAPVGDVAKTDYDIVLGRGVAGIKGNQFIFQLLKKYKEDGYWKKISTGSTFESINSNIIKEAKLLLPSAKEQNYLGDFFYEMDQTITLLQRKIDNLNKVKKGLLQKLFPSEQSINPKIRFSGFNQDWEQRELGDVAAIYDGTHQTPKYKDNGIMFLSVENIKTLKSNKFISNDDFEKEFKVYPQKDDVLMTRIGDIGTTNVVAMNDKLAYYVSLALIKSKYMQPYFLSYLISSNAVQNDIWRRTLHIAFPKKINKNEIAKISISKPSLEEQLQIGNLLKNIDDTITFLQKELEMNKQVKKGFLQKLFPKE
ncbi:restriction endonuclease subunit S [Macrococcoides caseolyticum]|uniref:restriction endonuclease subunit S n=1 Tax=Macrococcoides caseolyticum TaxID=69966 RepID=UPI000C33E374|nr:restriction endonuclease subunit S [Macrococcus caseolyticus]PKE61115.1 restriction endonuclease subunit S [Macrococcus caseolyticus]